MSNDTRLRYDDFSHICELFMGVVNEQLLDDHNRLDAKYVELERYYPTAADKRRGAYGWNIEKIKILFELLKLRNADDAEKILNFMENIRYGWMGGKYRFVNPCLTHNDSCKRNLRIDNTHEETRKAFDAVSEIFLSDKVLGGVTIYLFGYCIAALFSTLLKQSSLRIPFYLQIACEQNSNLYKLIHEIVEICDINTGLLQHCDKVLNDYGYCEYDYTTVYPARNIDKELEELVCNRDVPVIIDGYENDKLYTDFIREVANMPGRKRHLHYKDSFRLLPIFLCPVVKSRFKNVLTMDLNGLDVSDEYLELINLNKQRLASWVFELVKDFREHIPVRYEEGRQTPLTELAMHRGIKNRTPLFSKVSGHINNIRKYNQQFPRMSPKDIVNIGYLAFFFRLFMDVFNRSIKLTEDMERHSQGETTTYNTSKLVQAIYNQAVRHLFKLHNSYSSLVINKTTVATTESDPVKAKQIVKKGEDLAKGIVKYYLSYGVSIEVMPDATYADERYIFNVALLPGTDIKLISRYTDEVRRLLGMEFMWVSSENKAIKIVISDKPLKEVSLINILESEMFEDSIKTMAIPYAVGYDAIRGGMVIADIKEFPHLIVGGTTGYGKSSALHSIIMSIVYKQSPDKVRIMLLDFGASKLNFFNSTPHILGATVERGEEAKGMRYLLILKEELERREVALNRNHKALDDLPSIVCIVDEFPTLAKAIAKGKDGKEANSLITEILDKARKTKIHMILAANNASKGNIGINITSLPAGIAFKCTTVWDSMSIIQEPIAKNLSGKGSMYFKCHLYESPARLQGSYIALDEIIRQLNNMEFNYDCQERYKLMGLDESRLPTIFTSSHGQCDYDGDGENNDNDSNITSFSNIVSSIDTKERKLAEIIMWALSKDKFSNNQIKKRFEMGYDKANRFLIELERLGITTELREGTKLPRTVIPMTIGDLSDNVVSILNRCGYTLADIEGVINHKN